jgi:uncharacterized protein (DUF1800 family)
MSSTVESFIAANRFGLGARPGELKSIGHDPRGWLRAQLRRPHALPKALSALPAAADSLAVFLKARRDGVDAIKAAFKDRLSARYREEAEARALAHTLSDAPFFERLVAFWSNHFTVSGARFFVAPAAGAYEREAIRPHVLGRFGDMLRAVAAHPVMLLYLDNAGSIGPASIAARMVGRGLNENLAREILELHTLGVNGGYTQKDVTEFARILTGWSVEGLGPRAEPTGRFRFVPAAHEPGSKTLLGQVYAQGGAAEAEAALADLARHPSTARFVATKLARHFVADDPPAPAIDRLARVFTETGGDLRAVSDALIELPQAWQTPLPKVKTPYEYAISAFRALGLERAPERGFVPTLFTLGQLPFRAPSPAGWPDKSGDWLSPEALMRRLEWARVVGRLFESRAAPDVLFANTIASVASPVTRAAIMGAASPGEGVALVLASAEFQRR